MWRGLPSELPSGIDNVDYGNDTRGTQTPNFRDKGDYITSTYPVIATPFYGAQFSVPRKPLANDSVNTRPQDQPRGTIKANLHGLFEVELRNADAELERALLESLNTTNFQPRLNYEER